MSSKKNQKKSNTKVEVEAKLNPIIEEMGDKLADKVETQEFNNLFRSHVGLASIFVEYNRDNIKLLNKNGDGYTFSIMNNLWVYRDACYFPRTVADFLDVHLNDVIQKYRDSGNKDMDTYKKLLKVQTSICNITFCEKVFDAAKRDLIDCEFPAKLNKVSYLVPIRKGRVVNLKTLEVRQRTSKDLFDFEVDADVMKGETPRADKFFREIMNNDTNVLEYLQTNLGYCMTGETDQRCIYILWGEGSNGKSCLMNVLQKAMNKLAVTVDKKVFVKTDSGSNHTAHLIPLVGARAAVMSEMSENEELNDKTIKQLTGGDEISARQLYGKQFNFKPCAKYLILTNYKPILDVSDIAMVDRVRYFPFLARFTDDPKGSEIRRDTKFIDELLNHHFDEIFTWLCRGAFKYYSLVAKNQPIPIPKSLTEAKNAYMAELDTVSKFVDESCEKVVKNRYKRGDLFAAYQVWCSVNNETHLRDSKFYKRLEVMGYAAKKSQGNHYITGLKLKVNEEPLMD
jgi:P4 family phage/plasmid primase-like protien